MSAWVGSGPAWGGGEYGASLMGGLGGGFGRDGGGFVVDADSAIVGLDWIGVFCFFS